MSKRLQFLLLLVILVPPPIGAAGEQVTVAAPHGISPVYEQMLAHQVYLRWNELIQKGKLKRGEPFWIVGWEEKESALAREIVSSLRRERGTLAQWDLPPHDWKDKNPLLFRGAVLIEADTKNLQDAASYIGRLENEGFLLVFGIEPIGRVWLESIFEKAGLEIQRVMALPELEFMTDEKGRQAVDLNLPSYQNMIYERLVREGMNPVRARPAADQAIQNFRRSLASKILLVSKMKTG